MTALESPFRLSFIGQFLLRKGLVTESQLLEAVGYQQDINELIGDIAVRREYMTSDDVAAILQTQRESSLPFGQIAVNQGRMTEAQRESLVQTQAMGYVFLGEALLAKGFITAEQFVEAINEFTRMEHALAACNKDILFCSEHRELFLTMVDSLRNAVEQQTGVAVKMGKVLRPAAMDEDGVAGVSAEAGMRFEVGLLDGLILRFWALFPNDLADRLMGTAVPPSGPAGSWAGVTATPWHSHPPDRDSTWLGLARSFIFAMRRHLAEHKYGDFRASAHWVRVDEERAAMSKALMVNLDCPVGTFLAGFAVEDAGTTATRGFGDREYEHSF